MKSISEESGRDSTSSNPGAVPVANLGSMRSRRAKLADRFEEEMTTAILEGLAAGTQTGIFLIDVDPVELRVWDQTSSIKPGLVSEAVVNALSESTPNMRFSALGSGNIVGFVPDVTDPESLTALGEGLLTSLASPFIIEEVLTHIVFRVGAAIVGSSAQTAGEALEHARIALQETTEATPCVTYSPKLARRREQDAGLEYDFKLALNGGLLDVVYQPIVSLTENRIAGVEAFARWTHPELGEILPAQFLNIAERSGTIRQLGEQVLIKAMTAADRWAQYDGLTNLVLWVNFSPTEIAYPDFEPTIKSVIHQYPRVQLGLELAESSLIEERLISTTLRRLRSLGVRTSVDDFSSKDTAVARLRALPFDNVKLGRDLIRTLPESADDRAVVELLTELGKRSDFTVSSVGIETEEQLELIRSLGVDCAQGYLLARPATAVEIENLLVATLSI